MTKTTKGEIVNELSMSTSLNVDKNDVLAIAISEAEDMMNTKLVALKEAKRNVEASITETTKKVAETKINQLKKAAKKDVTRIVNLFGSLGQEVKTKYADTEQLLPTPDAYPEDADDPKLTFRGTVLFEKKEEFEDVAYMHGTYITRCDLTKLTLILRPDGHVMKAHNRLEELTAQRSEINAEIVDWKRKLTNLPQLERKYKAKLAKEQLSQFDEGKEIVEKLTATLADDVLKLSSN